MTPRYLEQLADLADPDELWRLAPLDQLQLPPSKRHQLDTGVALRRHASHIRMLGEVLAENRSLLITPIRHNEMAVKPVDTPPEHEALKHR